MAWQSCANDGAHCARTSSMRFAEHRRASSTLRGTLRRSFGAPTWVTKDRLRAAPADGDERRGADAFARVDPFPDADEKICGSA